MLIDLHTLLSRCDAYIEASGMTEAALSKRLFNGDGGRIRLIRKGGDVGVRKIPTIVERLSVLEKASSELETLEKERLPNTAESA